MASTTKQVQFDRQLDLMQIREFRRNGDIHVLANLYSKYLHLTYGLCLKYLGDRTQAKATVQEIFEKITIETVKKEVIHFKPWLYAVSRQICLKKAGQNLKVEKGIRSEELAKNHPLDDDLHLTDYLAESIAKLDRKQKQIIDLFYKKNKCYREIALKSGISEDEVKRLIFEAKQNILLLLDEHARNQQTLNSE